MHRNLMFTEIISIDLMRIKENKILIKGLTKKTQLAKKKLNLHNNSY